MNMLSKHLQTSRQGHSDGLKRVFDTGRDSAKDTLSLIDNTHIILDLTLQNANNGKDFCLDSEVDIPCENAPPVPLLKRRSGSQLMMDANHKCFVSKKCRSVTVDFLFLNNTLINGHHKDSQRQKTVKTFTHGSELVSTRLRVELVMKHKNKQRNTDVEPDGPELNARQQQWCSFSITQC